MLSLKVPLLESKITNLETINSNWEHVDSLRSTQVNMYKSALEKRDQDISHLRKSLKFTKVAAGGSVLVSVILALICALK